MNSACAPFAVCSTTHGAIFVAAASSLGEPPGFVAREELIAASAAMAAAVRNNEPKIRRHRDGKNVWFVFKIIKCCCCARPTYTLNGCSRLSIFSAAEFDQFSAAIRCPLPQRYGLSRIDTVACFGLPSW